MATHLIICCSFQALVFLSEEYFLLGMAAGKGKPVVQGDALVARDILLEAGFVWGKDFYLRKVDS